MTGAFQLRPQLAADIPAIEALHAAVFGPGRFTRTAYRIREASACGPLIAVTAWHGGELAGSVQFTAITIGGRRGAALLGPLVVAPAYQSKGYGQHLMSHGLEQAAERGYELAVLIGDLPYYQRAGFRAIPVGQILLPGPADTKRFLAKDLCPGALTSFSGMVAADNAAPFEAAAAAVLKSA